MKINAKTVFFTAFILLTQSCFQSPQLSRLNAQISDLEDSYITESDGYLYKTAGSQKAYQGFKQKVCIANKASETECRMAFLDQFSYKLADHYHVTQQQIFNWCKGNLIDCQDTAKMEEFAREANDETIDRLIADLNEKATIQQQSENRHMHEAFMAVGAGMNDNYLREQEIELKKQELRRPIMPVNNRVQANCRSYYIGTSLHTDCY